jgi:hypothetical protein
VAGVTELFGRYHRVIGELASRCLRDEAWRSDLQQILQRLDDDCRSLSRSSSDVVREELANQIEHEFLRRTDPDARAVLTIVLKHLEAG